MTIPYRGGRYRGGFEFPLPWNTYQKWQMSRAVSGVRADLAGPARQVPSWLQGGRTQPPAPAQAPPQYQTSPLAGGAGAGRATTARTRPPTAPVPYGGYQYPIYLPTTYRTGGTQPGAAPAQPAGEPYYFDPRRSQGLTPARAFGRYGYAMGHVLDPANYGTDPGRQFTPPGAGPATTGAGGRGGGGPRFQPAPEGVNAEWYKEFQRQHEGQTPEQYYAQTGEGLPHAMADEEWARGFAEMYGRPPTDDDWRAHWFTTRTGATPEERDRWRMEQAARRVMNEGKKEEEQRPPTYQPPPIIWR